MAVLEVKRLDEISDISSFIQGIEKAVLTVPDLDDLYKCIFSSSMVSKALKKSYVSTMIVAPPAFGKSTFLNKFSNVKNVEYTDRITEKNLKHVLDRVQVGEKDFLVIPDLTALFQNKEAVVQALVGRLNICIEEGVKKDMYYGSEFTPIDGKPVKFGFHTASTPRFMDTFNRSWNQVGFLSRLLFMSVDLGKDVVDLYSDLVGSNKLVAESFNLKPKKITISKVPKYEDENVFRSFFDYVGDEIVPLMSRGYVSDEDSSKTEIVRIKSKFDILIKTYALIKGEKKVTKELVEDFKRIARFFRNHKNPYILKKEDIIVRVLS